MSDQGSNGKRVYKDLVIFVDVGTRGDKRVIPRVIGQLWKDDKGIIRFRLDVVPVGRGWDGSGIAEDHDERVKKSEEKRAQRGGAQREPGEW